MFNPISSMLGPQLSTLNVILRYTSNCEVSCLTKYSSFFHEQNPQRTTNSELRTKMCAIFTKTRAFLNIFKYFPQLFTNFHAFLRIFTHFLLPVLLYAYALKLLPLVHLHAFSQKVSPHQLFALTTTPVLPKISHFFRNIFTGPNV
jgi:hypothetical protein